jgi:hypothetical protein
MRLWIHEATRSSSDPNASVALDPLLSIRCARSVALDPLEK